MTPRDIPSAVSIPLHLNIRAGERSGSRKDFRKWPGESKLLMSSATRKSSCNEALTLQFILELTQSITSIEWGLESDEK